VPLFAGIAGEKFTTPAVPAALMEEYVTPGPPYWFGSANGHPGGFGLILAEQIPSPSKPNMEFGPWIGIEEIALFESFWTPIRVSSLPSYVVETFGSVNTRRLPVESIQRSM
jgi:hypothetical protein